MNTNFLMKNYVARVSLVGTVMLPITSPLLVSKSIGWSVSVHSANLHGSIPPSEFLGLLT